ncbi:MAG: MFS transporter [Chloroflexi bacterium]|nr:MAG: MFS transporter [Chloroflexota bacterium]
MDGNWAAPRVRQNFRIDLIGAISAGVYLTVLVTFMPVVVRRMGGSAADVALIIAAPFVGHLLSPIGTYLYSGIAPVRVVAATATLGRLIFLGGVLLATGPDLLAITTVIFFIISTSNIGAYTTLMQGIYPDTERARAMANVRIGSSIAGIAAAAFAGAFIDVLPASVVFMAAALFPLPGAIAFFGIRFDRPRGTVARRSVALVARDIWADRRYRRLLLAATVFGVGNLMNVAMYPLLLVDHFQASNSFIGAMTVVTSATSIIAYLVWGRVIDRGSSIRLTLVNCVVTILIPVGFIAATDTWQLIPVAIITGIVNAGGELTFFTNIVQLAPRERIVEYAAAQSFVMGIRGTLAPFVASALLGLVDARAVLLTGVLFMTTGAWIMSGAVRLATQARVPTVPAPAHTPAD